MEEIRLDVLQECKDGLDKIFKKKWPIAQTYQIRGSNQPFCPRKYWLTKQNGLTRNTSINSKLYLEMGKVVHNVIQSFIAQHVEVYCKWFCSQCGKTLPYDWYTANPVCCDIKMIYEEYSAKHSEIGLMNMHVDGIVKINGTPCVLEIKTTNKDIKIPDNGYKLQANLYCNLLNSLLGTEIYIIMYIKRGNLERQYFPYYMDKHVFAIQKYLYELALWSDQTNEIPGGICIDKPDRFCSFKDICFKYGEPDKGMEALIARYNGIPIFV